MMEEEDLSEQCPFCRKICNCNVCLHSAGVLEVFYELQFCIHLELSPKKSHRNCRIKLYSALRNFTIQLIKLLDTIDESLAFL